MCEPEQAAFPTTSAYKPGVPTERMDGLSKREYAAIAIAQGLAAGLQTGEDRNTPFYIAQEAIDITNELLSQLEEDNKRPARKPYTRP